MTTLRPQNLGSFFHPRPTREVLPSKLSLECTSLVYRRGKSKSLSHVSGKNCSIFSPVFQVIVQRFPHLKVSEKNRKKILRRFAPKTISPGIYLTPKPVLQVVSTVHRISTCFCLGFSPPLQFISLLFFLVSQISNFCFVFFPVILGR